MKSELISLIGENHPDIMILQLLVDPFTNLLKISMRGLRRAAFGA